MFGERSTSDCAPFFLSYFRLLQVFMDRLQMGGSTYMNFYLLHLHKAYNMTDIYIYIGQYKNGRKLNQFNIISSFQFVMCFFFH